MQTRRQAWGRMLVAGEPESLDMDEPLSRRVQRHNFDRLLMLSDGVFAIAITLLVLDIRPPKVWDGDLLALLQQSWRSLFGYVFGFAAVGGFWVAHRAIFARLRHVDGPATGLSLALLLFVGLVPAAAALVSEHGPAKGIPAYLFLVTTIAGIQALLWTYAAFIGDLVDISINRRARLIRLVILCIPFLIFGLFSVIGIKQMSGWLLIPVLAVVVAARLMRRRLGDAA